MIIPFFIGGENMEISYIIEILLTAGISVITFLMKRTINELDSELDNCKRNIAQIKEDYITKEDFFREQNENRRKLDRIMDILLEVKGEIGNG